MKLGVSPNGLGFPLQSFLLKCSKKHLRCDPCPSGQEGLTQSFRHKFVHENKYSFTNKHR